MNKLHKLDIEHLEELIDKSSIKEVVCALIVICEQKAEHIREAWQDDKTAKPWDKDSKTLEILATKLFN